MTNLDLYNEDYSAKRADAPYGISAGGVVYRGSAQELKFLLLGRERDGEVSYHLPKGTLHIDETLEQCAVREIAEEAGVEVALKTYLGGKHSEIVYHGEVSDKLFHYYAAEFIGDTNQMDDEHDFREWVSYEEAIERLKHNKKREDIFITRCHEYLSQKNG